MSNTPDLDDLRRTLAEHAADAPEGTGVLDTVLATAPRRRRRKAFQAAALALAVIAAGVSVPLLLDGTDKATRNEPSAPTTPPVPVILMASLAPDGGYVADEYGFIGTTQHFAVRPVVDDPLDRGGMLAVYAPGTFDPGPYTAGERVDVNGMPGYFVARFEYNMARATEPYVPAFDARLAWQAPDGRWMLYAAHGEPGLETALRAARAVRLNVPWQAFTPLGLPALPGGVRVQTAQYNSLGAELVYAAALPPDAASAVPYFARVGDTTTTGFSLGASKRNESTILAIPDTPPTRIGEADTWYVDASDNNETDNERPYLLLGPHEARVSMTTNDCVVIVNVKDTRQFPRPAIEAFIAGIDFRDCDAPSTWVPLNR